MIGQGKGGITDFCGEGFDEIGCDGSIDHADKDDLNENEQNEFGQIWVCSFLGGNLLTRRVKGHRRELDLAGDLVGSRLNGDDVVSGGLLHGLVDRNVSDHSEQTGGHHQPLAPDAVGESAKKGEEGQGDEQSNGHNNIGGSSIHLQDGLQIEERVKLPCVPDDALTSRCAEEGDQHALQVAPNVKASVSGLAEIMPELLIEEKMGDSRILRRMYREMLTRTMESRKGTRQPQPVNCSLDKVDCVPNTTRRETKRPREGSSNLDKAGVEAALVVWNVFRDIDCSATVFAAECKALKDADQEQGNGCKPACGLVGREQAYDGCSAAHNAQGDKKGVFATNQVANSAKEQGAERPHDKPHGKVGEISNQRKSVIASR